MPEDDHIPKEEYGLGTPWVWKHHHPLFWEPISDHPIDTKLANTRAAIAAGADVNELDQEVDPRRNNGRPLHFALSSTINNFKYLKENLPVIKLLLESGADPRLQGMRYTASALEEAMNELRGVHHNKCFQPEFAEVKPFYQEAYKLLKQAADELDGMFALLYVHCRWFSDCCE